MKGLLKRMKDGDVVVVVTGKVTENLRGILEALVKRNNSLVVKKVSRKKRHITIKEVYDDLIVRRAVIILTDKAEYEAIVIG
ncbi:MAG: hypothetical protein A2536_06415 [Candidatus Firestonebacteria bacterium RIFOXYD2_FULL_39_29]|nr:MAG: hypothetical protein A2536_06415 [Candidatus Firestonebacteria bacterium RIFOXYD2_FULL_39_29]